VVFLSPSVFSDGKTPSAGASTRLLFDYAEPYRSDVLDFLFKPSFGAAFQHLKVEIGGGENSTCGIKEFDARQWHTMKIVLRADAIQGCLEGKVLAEVKDASRSNGMAYLASSYNGNLFDNVNLSAP
jgi:galactosylceramidase